MARKMAEKAADPAQQERRHDMARELAAFANEGAPVQLEPEPQAPSRKPKGKSSMKKFVGFYLPPEQVRWLKRLAFEQDAKMSHVLEAIINEARTKNQAN